MIEENFLPGLGEVIIRAIGDDEPRPFSTSIFEDWGEVAPEAHEMSSVRWMVEVRSISGDISQVGDLLAHPNWYGPTVSSKAMQIGVSLVDEFRGKGIGSICQRLLAFELHRQGYTRVEAFTDVENIAEQRALRKAGFELEGVVRKAQGRADGIHDLQVWSHIAE